MKNFLKKTYEFSSSWTGTIIIVLLIIFFIAQAFVIPSGSMKNTLLIKDFLFAKKFSYGITIPRLPMLNVPLLPDFFGNGHLIEGERPKRGEIVIFAYPKDNTSLFVKRLFAVGGDEVIATNKAIYLRPNEGDKFIDENYDKNDIVILGGKKFVKEPYKFGGIHYDKNIKIFEIFVKFLATNNFYMNPIHLKEFTDYEGLPFNAFYAKIPQDEFFMIGDNRDHSNDSRFWGTVPYKNIIGTPWFVYLSIDDNWAIRWERVGKSVDTLQNDEKILQKAYLEEEVGGIY